MRVSPIPDAFQTEHVIAICVLIHIHSPTLHQPESLVRLEDVLLADAAFCRVLQLCGLLLRLIRVSVPATIAIHAVALSSKPRISPTFSQYRQTSFFLSFDFGVTSSSGSSRAGVGGGGMGGWANSVPTTSLQLLPFSGCDGTDGADGCEGSSQWSWEKSML